MRKKEREANNEAAMTESNIQKQRSTATHNSHRCRVPPAIADIAPKEQEYILPIGRAQDATEASRWHHCCYVYIWKFCSGLLPAATTCLQTALGVDPISRTFGIQGREPRRFSGSLTP